MVEAGGADKNFDYAMYLYFVGDFMYFLALSSESFKYFCVLSTGAVELCVNRTSLSVSRLGEFWLSYTYLNGLNLGLLSFVMVQFVADYCSVSFIELN